MKKIKYGLLLLGMLAMLLASGCGGSGASNADKVSNPNGAIGYAAHDGEVKEGIPKQLHEGITANIQKDGVELVEANADGNTNLQLDQVNKMIDDKVSAIVLLAVNGDSIIPAVQKANAAGIPIIATNRDVNGGEFTNVICNERQGGELQAEFMANKLPQDAKIVYLKGDMTLACSHDRWDGFREKLASLRPDVKIIATSTSGDWSFADGIKNMTLWMEMFPQIDGIAAANDNEALGAMYAMRDAGRLTPETPVCGIDATAPSFAAMEEGYCFMTVKQDVDGIVSTIHELLQGVHQGIAPEKGNTMVPMLAITKDNMSQHK